VRRQALPEGALAEAQEAAGKADKGGVYMVSHGWLQPGHPDPTGARKKDVLELIYGNGG